LNFRFFFENYRRYIKYLESQITKTSQLVDQKLSEFQRDEDKFKKIKQEHMKHRNSNPNLIHDFARNHIEMENKKKEDE